MMPKAFDFIHIALVVSLSLSSCCMTANDLPLVSGSHSQQNTVEHKLNIENMKKLWYMPPSMAITGYSLRAENDVNVSVMALSALASDLVLDGNSSQLMVE
jgi:hypothetical protein